MSRKPASIAPCPFCGFENQLLSAPLSLDEWYVKCDICKARGPMIENGETGVDGTEWEGMDEIEMAWAYWNQWADNFSETDVEKMRKGKAE